MSIKFRAKRKDNNQWVYGSLIGNDYVEDQYTKQFIVTCFSGTDGLEIIESFEVHPETVCQYLNMEDKDDNELYEKDIIRQKCFDDDDYDGVETMIIENINDFMKDVGFKMQELGESFRPDALTLVGNCFDDLELKKYVEDNN